MRGNTLSIVCSFAMHFMGCYNQIKMCNDDMDIHIFFPVGWVQNIFVNGKKR